MTQPLSFVQVIADQHIAECMGCEGHSQAITPNMDRLAAKGVRFTNAYAANPICTPARVSMLSGQYPHNHGYFGLSGPQPGTHGTRIIPNLFAHLKQAGYRTAGIGKLHLPDSPRNWIADDVDLFADCYRATDGSKDSLYFKHLESLGLREKEDSVGLPEFPGKQQMEGRPSFLPYKHNVENWCAQQTVKFISESNEQGKPFYIQMSLPRPHQCYTPDQRFWDMYPEDLDLPETYKDNASLRPPHFQRMLARYERDGDDSGLLEPKGLEKVRRRIWRAYLACITQCDDALGIVMDHLQAKGLDENTVVLYTADHGAYSTHFGLHEKAPGICSEKVCRIPMILYAPGVSQAGSVCEQFVSQVDFAPTFTALAGAEAMTTVDGFDLSALLRGENTPVRDVVVTELPWSKSLRYKHWRFVHYQRGMFDQDLGDQGELYHIKDDPHERQNLYNNPEYQSVVNECRRRVLEWLIETSRVVTCLPVPNQEEQGTHFVTVDGREPAAIGPAARVRRGRVEYL